MDDVLSIFRKTELSGDCYVETTTENRLEYEANEYRGYAVREDTGFGLRLIDEVGRVGFFSSNDFSRLKEALEQTEAISRYGNEAGFEIPSYVVKEPWNELIDQRVVSLQSGDLAEIGEFIVSRLQGEFPDVLTNVTIVTGQQDKQLINHREENIGFSRTYFQVTIEVNRTRDHDIFEVSSEYAWGSRDINLEELLQELFHKLEHSKNIVSLGSGQYPVLFTPTGSMVLWYPLLYGLNGKNIVFKRSPLADKLHQAILSPLLTLKELNHEPWALGSAPFDDEGITTREERMVVEEGTLQHVFLDLWSAGKTGFPSMAGGYRPSYRELPEAGFGNLMIEGGLRNRETLVEEIDRGLIVDSVLGLGQSNVAGGHFSCNVQLGYLVEKGEIQGRVKDLMISGNAYDALRNLKEISRDSRWIHGRMLLPYLLIEPIQVDSPSK